MPLARGAGYAFGQPALHFEGIAVSFSYRRFFQLMKANMQGQLQV
jgi:hypothetical protein